MSLTEVCPTRIQRSAPLMRWIAGLLVFAMTVFAVVVLGPATQSNAASYVFLVDSLSPIGNDINPGDGICRTATNTCTLRAALQESNALNGAHNVVIAPAEDVDSATPGVQSTGTIVGSGVVNTTNFMHVGTLTNAGDAGAYFMATAAVTMDFQNRLGIASLNDANGATGIYINGPDVILRNFSNIKTNETSIVISGAGDRALIENGSILDPGSPNAERGLWFANGADNVTVRNVEFGSLWSGGGAIVVAASAVIDGLTFDRIRMFDPDAEGYDGFATAGGSSTRATMTNFTIKGSTFEGFKSGYHPLDLRDIDMAGFVFLGNTLTRNGTGATPIIQINRPSSGAANVISRNVFDNNGASASYGIYAILSFPSTGVGESGWRVEDNYFDGFTTQSLFLQSAGTFTFQRNTWGTHSANAGGGIDEESRHWAAFYQEWTTGTNLRRATWVPVSATANAANCTVTVNVTPPTDFPYNLTLPTTPVSIDVYYTSVSTASTAYAEVYLGRQSVTAAGPVTLPYTLGSGFLRLQTIDAGQRSSQYSRTVSLTAPDSCGPNVTVEQALAQADPTSVRDLSFVVNLSEPIAATGAGSLQPSDFATTGSTAVGAQVTAVTKLSETRYAVTARANGAGTVVLSLPAGSATDLLGNPSFASTSVDNSVEFVLPLTLDPVSLSVTEGGAATTYSIGNVMGATAPITIQPTVANPAWASATPATLTIPTIESAGTLSVTAVDDNIVNGARATTISHTVSSADQNYDGLLLPIVNVTVVDNDTPSAAESSLAVSTGTVVADGVATHTATATARNASGVAVQGALVNFSIATGPTLSAASCLTGPVGTCAVTITSDAFGTFAVSALIGGVDVTDSPASVTFGAGPASALESTISASPTTVTADGTSTSTITVQGYDALGNIVSEGGATVAMSATAGTLSGVTDNGDGTYTAVLQAPVSLATATVSFTVGGVSSPSTATVSFVAGVASPARSTISASPTSVVANGVTTSQITVVLLDAFDNPTSAGGPAVISTNAGTLSATTDDGNGVYTATLTSATAVGAATLSFTVAGAAATNTAQVAFTPGAADPATSEISVSAPQIVANGVSTTLVTVQLKDAFGNALVSSGGAVTMTASAGSLGAVTDHGNGTYSAVLTSATAAGVATVGFAIDATPATAEATVTFVAGPASAATSTISVTPTSLVADGSATAVATVVLRDAFGNPLSVDAPVVISTDLGSVGGTTLNGDGTASAVYTAATVADLATLSFTVSGVASPNQATVDLTPGAADAGSSTVAAAPTRIEANGLTTSVVTVRLKDVNGNQLTSSGGTVEIRTSLGSVGPTTDAGDGTYTATVTSATAIGVAAVTFTLDSVLAPVSANIQFVSGAASLTTSTIDANPVSITADGTSTSELTVTLRDSNGNLLPTSGGTVVMTSTAGTVGLVTDNGDGTYSATLTSGAESGTATVSFTIGGSAAADTATVDLLAGAVDLDRSTISASLTSIPAGGVSDTEITVSLLDAFGNLVGNGTADVEVFTTEGTLSAVTNNGDGTYTVTLTSSELATLATVSFTVDGAAGTQELTITFTAGVASPATSLISATPTSVIADGVQTSTVTVTLRDGYGNLVVGPDVVDISTTLGTMSAVTNNGDGTFTGTLTSATTTGTALLTFTVNAEVAGAQASVTFVPGAADAGTSTITASPQSIIADTFATSAITVVMLDGQGNRVTTGGDDVEITTDTGTISATTDNGNGTYTATLTSTSVASTATVGFLLNSSAGTATDTVDFVAGEPDAAQSTITALPTAVPVGGAASTITVTTRDQFGNPVLHGGANVTVFSDLGTISSAVDNLDGTYTAELLSSNTAGTATVGFRIDLTTSSATAQVVFEPGAADLANSEISASPTSIVADGVSTSTIQVVLRDGFGNQLGGGSDSVVISTDNGTLGATTSNGDGTYDATLTAGQVAGSAELSFTVNGADATATTEVVFTAGAFDLTQSLISAAPATITADGVSTSAVTVTLLDAFDNVVVDPAAVVTLTTSAGTLSAVTNNGDGTYTAQLTSTTLAQNATVSFAVDDSAGSATAGVTFEPGPVDLATSTIAAVPTSITADGVSTSAVTVSLRDAAGNLRVGAETVEILSTLGTVGATTDNGDGTYSAVLTSATANGVATVSFEYGGVSAGETTVEFISGAPSPDTSTIAADPLTIIADGLATSAITVTLLDPFGNPITTGAAEVTMSTTAGTLGAVTNNADGTYSAILTSATVAGAATVSFTVDGATATATVDVAFGAGVASATTSEISATPTSLTADGGSKSVVTVTLRDANGNALTTGGATVTIAGTLGTVGTVTDNGDGTYTADFTAGTLIGTAALTFTVAGTPATAQATIQLVPGAADPSTAIIVATPEQITADGASTADVKVTLLDAFGNQLGGGTDVVAFTTSAGTIGTASNLGDGTYLAELTSTTTAGEVATISFSVNGSPATAQATVTFVPGALDPTASTITTANSVITADGLSTTTVTVTMIDAYGNPLTTGGAVVQIFTDYGTIGPVTDNLDGTYSAVLTSTVGVGTATLTFRVGVADGSTTAEVDFVAGLPDPGTSTIAASVPTIIANGTSTSVVTVTLKDSVGNLVGSSGAAIAIATDRGTVSATTPNGDGTYSATLTSATTAGVATLSFTLDTVAGASTTTVEFVPGAADPGSSLISASPVSIEANGMANATVTVTLVDAFGNPLVSGGGVVTIATTAGTVGVVNSNGDGTYTAQLTSSTVAEVATVSFAVDAAPATATATVSFVPGAVDPTLSTITASPATLVADGTSSSVLTVILKDGQGNTLAAGGETVVMSSTLGALSAVTDNNDGTYTAVLTSTTSVGAADITFTVGGVSATDFATVLFLPGAASTATSTISASPTTVVADGVSTSTVTVQLRDANGNLLTSSGGTVVILSSAGTISPATDHLDGTYTAQLTAPVTPATANLTFTVSGGTADNSATVSFVPGPVSATSSTIAPSVTQVEVDTSSTVTITVTARDALGNPTGASVGPVTMSTTLGTLGPVTDVGDGTYTAQLNAPTLADVAVVSFTINSTPGTETATVTFLPGVASPGVSTITVMPDSIVADGSSTSTVTVKLFDGQGNPLTTGGDTVTVATSLGTLGSVTDNGNGTYTAILTSSTVTGNADVTFTVNGSGAAARARDAFVPGAVDPGHSEIVASPTSLVAGSPNTSAITVTLRDVYGNLVGVGGATVEMAATAGVLSDVTDNGNGSYTATLLAGAVLGSADISYTVDGAAGAGDAVVNFVGGSPDAATSTIESEWLKLEADGASTSKITVTLFDAYGNRLSTGGADVTMETSAGVLSGVTDNGDGTATAVLTSATDPGAALITFRVGGVLASATATVTFEDTTAPDAPVITKPADGDLVHVVVEFAGTGEPGSRVTVSNSDGEALCSAEVAADGTWFCTPAQRLPAGPLTVSAIAVDLSGNVSVVSVPVNVTVVAPSATVSAASIPRGTEQTITGAGFIPGETVTGVLFSTPIDLGSQVADADGTVTFVVLIPADFELGQHQVTLTGSLSGAVSVAFEVVAAPVAPTVPPVDLPKTGAQVAPLLLLGGLLIGAGLLLRRRRTATLRR